MLDLLKSEIMEISSINLSEIKEDDLLENLGIDSFGVICLISNLSEKLKIEIPISDIENLRTVSDFVNYLEDKKK